MRIWGLPNRTHQFLQQTCMFDKGPDSLMEEVEGQILTHVVWNSNGKLIAGAMDNLVNVWATAGIDEHGFKF